MGQPVSDTYSLESPTWLVPVFYVGYDDAKEEIIWNIVDNGHTL